MHRTISGAHSARLSLLALLPQLGCFYAFDNPVEQLDAGTLAGQITLANALPGETTQGGQVQLLWSGLQIPLDSTGRFQFVDLPDGIYAVSYSVPPLASNDTPLLGLRTGVQLPALDAVYLGDLQLAASGTVGGRVVDDAGAPAVAVIAAYAQQDGGALGVYEGYATTSQADGTFLLTLPAGSHLLAASTAAASVVAPVALQPNQSLTVPLTLEGPGAPGSVLGNLVFGGPSGGAAAMTTSQGAFLLGGVSYVAENAAGAVVSDGGLYPPAQDYASDGGAFELILPAGEPLTIWLLLNVATANETFSPLQLAQIPLVAGQPTQLGEVFWPPSLTSSSTTSGTGTTGGTTGGTSSGTGGGTSGGGTTGSSSAWQALESPLTFANDASDYSQLMAFPVFDGGRALFWQFDTQNQEFPTLAVAMDLGGGFGSSSTLPLTLGQPGDSCPSNGVATPSGTVLAFGGYAPDSGASAVNVVLLPPAGSASFLEPLSGLDGGSLAFLGTGASQSIATVAGSLGGQAGAFILFPVEGGNSDSLQINFLPYPVAPNAVEASPIVFDGGVNSGDLPVSLTIVSLAATSCQIDDFEGDAGFCLVGAATKKPTDQTFYGFVASILTATSPSIPTLVNFAAFPLGPESSGDSAIVSIAALPPDAHGLTSVAASLDTVANGTASSQPTIVGPFTSLATPPTVSTLALTASESILEILPWGGELVGFGYGPGEGQAGNGTIAGVPLVDGGATPPLLNGTPSYGSALQGYTDPASGLPTLAVFLSDAGEAAVALAIEQLQPPGP